MPLGITVEHAFPGFTLAAAFTAPAQGITALFGPSGSGKSTILKAMAGLLRAERLVMDFSGERLDRVAASRRRFGMVFQEGRLFPHLSVPPELVLRLEARATGRADFCR